MYIDCRDYQPRRQPVQAAPWPSRPNTNCTHIDPCPTCLTASQTSTTEVAYTLARILHYGHEHRAAQRRSSELM